MEILLWKTIDKLGEQGEVVDVAPGYARNYLFRKGWATPNTAEHRKKMEQQKERLKREEQKRIEESERKAEALQDIFCVLEVETNEEGVLFGSVTPKMIADRLTDEHGLDVSAKHVTLKKPIKHVGTYKVPINFHTEVQGTLHTWVVSSGQGHSGPSE